MKFHQIFIVDFMFNGNLPDNFDTYIHYYLYYIKTVDYNFN